MQALIRSDFYIPDRETKNTIIQNCIASNQIVLDREFEESGQAGKPKRAWQLLLDEVAALRKMRAEKDEALRRAGDGANKRPKLAHSNTTTA